MMMMVRGWVTGIPMSLLKPHMGSHARLKSKRVAKEEDFVLLETS